MSTAKIDKKFISPRPIICQLLAMIPDEIFDTEVEACKSDRYSKRMKTRDHFICMFYAVLTRHSSLREICKNIALSSFKLVSAGLSQLPCRSTLSDANRKRDSVFFSRLYGRLYQHFKSRLKAQIMLIGGEVDPNDVEVFDSTTLTLFKEILKGAGRNPHEGKKKGGAKVFTQMNLGEGVPDFVCIKAAATNENTFLKVVSLPRGAIAVFDKGFNRYRYFDKWTEQGRYFVTRLKDNARYEVIQDHQCFDDSIDADQTIRLTYRHKGGSRTVDLRLVTYTDPLTGETLRFLTNLMGHTATTICLLYKNRWVIEVLFKRIKQNFELKYFISDSENGIRIQIWMALILHLLFTVLHKQIKEAEDFTTMVQIAAKNLSSIINFRRFLTNTEAYCRRWYAQEMGKVQLELSWSG